MDIKALKFVEFLPFEDFVQKIVQEYTATAFFSS
jgi:hypothetical protein